jgi:hypothetical protein
LQSHGIVIEMKNRVPTSTGFSLFSQYIFAQEDKTAGHQWFMPVILATQEVEIRGITLRSQPQANSSGDSISKIPRDLV